ncbi:MAG: hypothetical protein Q7T55_10105, partial [Solirubrobacteraceae bacterium]|nr:hypothetical protein [Solirubrobacteraceae bacterium]
MPTHRRRLPRRARPALLALVAVASVLSPASASAGLATTISPIAPGVTQLGSTIQPSARVANTDGAQSPTGSVAFHLCGPMAAESGCVSGGTSAGSATISGGGNPARATAATFRPTGLGWWCIRATYAGNATFDASASSGGCFKVVNPTLPSVSITPSSTTVVRGGTFSATVVGSHSAPSPAPASTPWASFSACDGSLGGCTDPELLGVIDTVDGRATSPVWTVPAGVSRVCVRSNWSGDAWNAQPAPLLTCADVTSPPLTSATMATLSASEVAQGGRPEVHVQVNSNGIAGKYRGDVAFSVCGPLQSASGCATGGRDLGKRGVQPSGAVTYPGVPATQPGVY